MGGCSQRSETSTMPSAPGAPPQNPLSAPGPGGLLAERACSTPARPRHVPPCRAMPPGRALPSGTSRRRQGAFRSRCRGLPSQIGSGKELMSVETSPERRCEAVFPAWGLPCPSWLAFCGEQGGGTCPSPCCWHLQQGHAFEGAPWFTPEIACFEGKKKSRLTYFFYPSPFSVIPYRSVIIPIKKLSNAITTSNPWICVSGELGDTGVMQIPKNLLEMTFEVSAHPCHFTCQFETYSPKNLVRFYCLENTVFQVFKVVINSKLGKQCCLPTLCSKKVSLKHVPLLITGFTAVPVPAQGSSSHR